MGIEERRQRERDEVREKILDAARELFVELGYEGVSMRKVAERIEYSPTTIYLYFADKETLFQQLCQNDFSQLAEEFQKVAQLPDPIRRLREIARLYVQFGVEHPNHYRLMFMTPYTAEQKDEPDWDIKGNPNKDAYAFLLQCVCSALQNRLFRLEYQDSELIAQTLWAAVHGVVSLQIIHKDNPWLNWSPLPDRSRAMLDGILRGLLRPEAANNSKE